MGDELPSFSVARLQRRVTEHRGLDFNAPLLSVRRAVADEDGGRECLWKLSSELKLEATCAVPFEWEVHPGRPKQQPPPTSLSPPSPPPHAHSSSSFSSSPSPSPSSPSSSSSSSSSPSSSASKNPAVIHVHPSFSPACPSPSSSNPFPAPSPPSREQHGHSPLQLFPQPHVDECRLVLKRTEQLFPENIQEKDRDHEDQKKADNVSIIDRLCVDKGQNGSFIIHTSYQATGAELRNYRGEVESPTNSDSGRLPLANMQPDFSTVVQHALARDYRGTDYKVGYFNPVTFLSIGSRAPLAQARHRALALEISAPESKASVQGKDTELTRIFPDVPRSASLPVCSVRYVTNTSNFLRRDSSLKGSPQLDHARNDQPESEGDEPLFYDAPSRFGSQTSTPVRKDFHGNGASMSWFDDFSVSGGVSKDFIRDGTIFRVDTPCASITDVCKNGGADFLLKRDCSGYSTLSNSKSSSSLRQRLEKALHVEVREKPAGVIAMKSAGTQLSEEKYVLADATAFGKFQEQRPELRNGICTKLQRYRSLDMRIRKRTLSPSTTSPIFPAKCGCVRNGGSKGVSAADEMGWPLGLSSYCADAQIIPSGVRQTDGRAGIPGRTLPSPPLPPSPSGSSWLQKALSSRGLKSSI